MTRNLASEFAPRKVLVNQVTPGATGTPIWSLIVQTEDAEEELEQRVSRSIPLGRFSEADEVAKAILYLASDDSASVSGTDIVVDGGATGAPLGAPILPECMNACWQTQTLSHLAGLLPGMQRIIAAGEPMVNIEEKETWDEGRVAWYCHDCRPCASSLTSDLAY